MTKTATHEPCTECEGGLEFPTPNFSESHPLPAPCSNCEGTGLVDIQRGPR